ncbi:endo-1,4-beta-xylanase 5-like isoform X2 [Triticum dicoccoides]|uniref:endo-1,4-beta-xylanase 5-like isoform X2 n=1 Tax=Triticum dicoccoides TaxID=85692 RepID=UPI001890761B|nr:endo-1,4-beta-xylanase 5-like isoform X2 [Triticum dicoccoides]
MRASMGRSPSSPVLSLVWAAAALLLNAALMVQSVPYDYSSSSECLAEPLEAHYGGGVIVNSDFSAGLQDWSAFGYGSVAEGASPTGNKYAVAANRTRPYQSVSQKVYLQNDTHYTLSAWLQVSDRSADVIAVVKTADDFIHAGGVDAKSGCWSILKGGLTAAASGPAELYFESNSTVDVWVDNVSLQPFSKEEWSSHRHAAVKKARKRTVRLRARDAAGNPVPGARVHVRQVRSAFPLGSAMSKEIITNVKYQEWFAKRFTVTTFENEMKWYSTEWTQGHEDYTVPDTMLRFARSHGIAVRGHNVFWDDPRTQLGWVKALSCDQLRAAAANRMRSVMSRYAGKVIAWDVVNENLHFDFFEEKFGAGASAAFYQKAHGMDGGALMSMNDFNTLEQPTDPNGLPSKYLNKLSQIKDAFPGNGIGVRMAIGLEGHFGATPSIPYVRAALDTLSQAGVPIWVTEVDVKAGPDQAYHLEQVLREVYSHPAVHGIVLWTAWHPTGCYVMCLTDDNFNNLPVGDTVDKLIAEWKTTSHVGVADADGHYDAELFHGDYQVTVTHPAAAANSTVVQSLSVDRESDNEYTIHV